MSTAQPAVVASVPIRFPMVDVPVATFGPGQYSLTDGCPEIVPFDESTLAALYPTKRDYVDAYRAATYGLLRGGFVLREDVQKLMDIARGVTILPDGRVRLDFNYAYNPSCAYDDAWACPLAPPENRLTAEIPAGEMVYST